jgi:alkanesulfonate monooxygenase SsuD/methylene tetrahydromethanopterin reductase-like flavin-dependent oxidoreductase (luciferase family)
MAGMGQLRQPRGTGAALRDPLPWPGFAGAARLAEELGYSAVFLPEIAGRDALAALNGLAGETARMSLGTGVLPMTSRTASLTAMGAATVQERSGGRAILGLGTGRPVPGALERLRDLVVGVRALLRGERVEGWRLSLPPPAPVPIWISALGPRALRTAGEVADGVLLNWCPPERVAQAKEAVRASAEAFGRDPAEITIAVYVRASLGGRGEAGFEALRDAAGEYASYPAYARQFAAVGLEEEARAAAEAHRGRRPGSVPGSLVRAVALVGEPRVARERLEAYRHAGADLPIVYPVIAGPDAEGSLTATLRALAPPRSGNGP